MGVRQPGKFGWIEQRGGSIRVRWRDENGKKQRAKCGPNNKLAEQFRRFLACENDKGTIDLSGYDLIPRSSRLSAPRLTVEKFIEEYLDYLTVTRNPGKLDATQVRRLESYKNDCTRVRTFFNIVGRKYVDELTLQDLDRYKQVQQEKLAAVTVNRNLAIIKPMLSWAHDRGYMPRDFRSKIKGFKVSNEHIVTVFPTLDMIKKMFKSCAEVAPDLLPLVWTLMKTGIRREDGWRFKKEWVKPNSMLIDMYASKSNKRIKIPLDADIQKLLVSLLNDSRNTTDLLFLDKDGNPWSEGMMKSRIKAIQKHSGIERKFLLCNCFRHTYATCITRAQGIDRAAAYLGHSDIRLTQRFYNNIELDYVTLGDKELPYNYFKIHGQNGGTNGGKSGDRRGLQVIPRETG